MIIEVRSRKVLATFPLHPAGISALAGRVDLQVADHDMLKEEELEPFLPGLSVLIVGSMPIGAATLAGATNLKVIARHGTGLDNIDLTAATRQRIVVTSVARGRQRTGRASQGHSGSPFRVSRQNGSFAFASA